VTLSDNRSTIERPGVRATAGELPTSKGHPRRQDRVLILVQNLPVPFDRRVWLECLSLTEAGFRVAVVCPKGAGDPSYARLNGVEMYKYRPYAPGGSRTSYVVEYLYSFFVTLVLSLKASKSGRFAVVQTCNPPDVFWPIGLLFRLLHGSAFVFDHHDLCPELYESRFSNGSRLIYRALRLMERCTVRTADHVIATNDSYRQTVLGRDGVDPAHVTVVRSGPDPTRLRRTESDPDLRRGRPHLAAYLGVMGPQDGVDIVLQMVDFVVHRLGRRDISFTLIGSGDCFDELVALSERLDLTDYVTFTGRIADADVATILSTADVGISPDPKNPLNDLSTMNKTMEYMAFSLPVVAFDLRETRVSAGDAAVYAAPNDVGELAQLLVELIDDDARRCSMGKVGRTRIEQELAWDHQAPRYVDVYEKLTSASRRRIPATTGA
jgi:glycosyltransferase involved in cell wall biosynthesis